MQGSTDDPEETLVDAARARGVISDEQARVMRDLIEQTLRLRAGEKSAPEEARRSVRRFGKFLLAKKLGEGGMGTVWKAWQCDLGRWVALKILKADDPEGVARFVREAQTAAKLSHPNIVSMYEAGELEGQHYIAMEFIAGDDLKKLRLPVARALELIQVAAEAVHYAHGEGIIHRDLKPQNLMLSEHGRLCVMDFGLARTAAAPAGLSVSGSILGTPSYMSPEQAGGQRVEARADVYSLGATLYELLTGHPPFEGASPLEILDQVRHRDPVPPRKYNPKVPGEVQTIVTKAMEKDPSRRYGSAQAFAEDLRRHRQGESILARPPGPLVRAVKWSRRHVVVTAIGATALAASAAIGTWQGWEARTRARQAEELKARASELMARRKWSDARELLVRALQIDSGAADAADLRDRCVSEMERHRENLVRVLEAGAQIEVVLQDRDAREANLTQLDERQARAEREIEAALQTSPDLAVAWYQRGRLKSLSWSFEEARRSFDRALELDAGLVLARMERANAALLEAATADLPHLSPAVAVAWKRSLLDRHREDFDILLSRRRELPSTARRAAEILEALLIFETSPATGEPALETLEEARVRTHDPSFLIWIGVLKLRLGDFAGACEVLRGALEERPYSILCRVTLARSLEGADDPTAALEQWDQAAQIDPRNPVVALGRGRCLDRIGKTEEALRALDGSDGPAIRMLRGSLLLRSGRAAEAESEFTEILRVEPAASRARVERAKALAAQGRYGEAVRDLERACADDADVKPQVAPLLEDYRSRK